MMNWVYGLTVAVLLFILIPLPVSAQPSLFRVSEGQLAFTSDAPLELIQAESRELRGLIDPAKNTFAFTVPIRSFQGFNSPLQREHFNENYLESDEFKSATFSGTIIEKIDYSINGTHTVRAKGKLVIHGIEQERIIKSQLIVEDDKLIVGSKFTVLLSDHDISIPKIVFQKIAEEIVVEINAEFIRE